MPGNDANTKLLVHCDGTNGSTTFTDVSASVHTVTATNATVDTSTSKFGGASATFNGTSARLVNTVTLGDFAFSGDFTVDLWINTSDATVDGAGANRRIWSTGDITANTGALDLVIDTSGHCVLFRFNVVTLITGSVNVANGAWRHIAIARSGTSMKLFVDGTQDGSTSSDATSFTDTTAFYIGVRGGAINGFWHGNVDEIRVSNIARWTANFTPPTAAYDSNSILTADVGAFSETGVAALFKISQLSAVGSFLETGVAAFLNPALTSAAGSYAVTGQAALFKVSFLSVVGSYTVTGQAAPFAVSMLCGTGSYIVTGNAASFVNTFRLPLYLRGASYWRGRS